jgi:uncharacterized membrane protein
MSLDPLLTTPLAIQVHAIGATAAIPLGLAQFVLPMNPTRHRILGWTWVVVMAAVAGSSFFIHQLRLVGPWSPIHLLSIFTLGALVAAVAHARHRRIRQHRRTMIGIYVGGLVAAGLFTLIPGRLMHAVLFGG